MSKAKAEVFKEKDVKAIDEADKGQGGRPMRAAERPKRRGGEAAAAERLTAVDRS